MSRSSTSILAGMLLCCCSWSLWADEISFGGEGREHPFMAVSSDADSQTPQASNWSIDGFDLVGTLGRAGRYDALVRYPEGRVERLSLGKSLVGFEAVLIEVTATTARLESAHGVFMLSFELPEELP